MPSVTWVEQKRATGIEWTNFSKLRRVLGLGAPNETDVEAWAQLLIALRDSTAASWEGAKASYLGLKKVRADLGLPFMASPTEGNPDAGGWHPDLDQQAVDLMVIKDILINSANDVLNNKRKLIYDPQINQFVIEQLPGDALRVVANQGVPVLMSTSTNQATHGSGTIGIPPLVIGAGAVVAVVQGLAVYAVAKEALQTLRTVSEQKTLRTLSDNQTQLIMSGKATPEQAAAGTKAIMDGAAAIKAKEVELETAKGQSGGVGQWTEFIKVAGVVGLGIAGLYLASKFVPARTPAMAAP